MRDLRRMTLPADIGFDRADERSWEDAEGDVELSSIELASLWAFLDKLG